MQDRVAELIDRLRLNPHPEGGYFAEVLRTEAQVIPEDGRPSRPALTVIYFLLPAGAQSVLHRVASDEVWQFMEGAPLSLHLVSEELTDRATVVLGPLGAGSPFAHVPAGAWQAARSNGAYTLALCTVAPGFSFDDFQLLRDLPDVAGRLTAAFPELQAML